MSFEVAPCRLAPRVAVVQDGARLHYALPVALQRAGMLGPVFTDWFARQGSREERIAALLRQVAPDLGRRMAGRACAELADARVATSPWLALRQHLLRRGGRAPEDTDLLLSEMAARRIIRQGWGGADALMGFVRNIHPDLCLAARRAGLSVVVDQIIAPAPVQRAEERRQAERWPAWRERAGTTCSDRVALTERQSWAAADHITCPSDYVRDGLLAEGIAAEKISVIPYPIDSQAFPFLDRSGHSGPVMVGFLGSVNLRKGAPLFLEVARRLEATGARFVMVGPVDLDTAAPATFGRVESVGAVPRAEVRAWLERFDILFFPSCCEGSAGAVMEAMASGLPVVSTPNSGTIVRDGIEGFLRACDDVAGFTECLARLIADADLRRRMAQAARRRAETFDLDAYSRSLSELFQRLRAERAAGAAACGAGAAIAS
jgi:glycosyltransferase involved in cell wall biosynthesis